MHMNASQECILFAFAGRQNRCYETQKIQNDCTLVFYGATP